MSSVLGAEGDHKVWGPATPGAVPWGTLGRWSSTPAPPLPRWPLQPEGQHLTGLSPASLVLHELCPLWIFRRVLLVTRRGHHYRENALLPHPRGTAHQQSSSSASSSEVSSSRMFPRTSSLPTLLTPAWPVTCSLLPADAWLPLCNENKPGLACLYIWEVSCAVSDQYIAAKRIHVL